MKLIFPNLQIKIVAPRACVQKIPSKRPKWIKIIHTKIIYTRSYVQIALTKCFYQSSDNVSFVDNRLMTRNLQQLIVLLDITTFEILFPRKVSTYLNQIMRFTYYLTNMFSETKKRVQNSDKDLRWNFTKNSSQFSAANYIAKSSILGI